jgi:hypothetical protein
LAHFRDLRAALKSAFAKRFCFCADLAISSAMEALLANSRPFTGGHFVFVLIVCCARDASRRSIRDEEVLSEKGSR